MSSSYFIQRIGVNKNRGKNIQWNYKYQCVKEKRKDYLDRLHLPVLKLYAGQLSAGRILCFIVEYGDMMESIPFRGTPLFLESYYFPVCSGWWNKERTLLMGAKGNFTAQLVRVIQLDWWAHCLQKHGWEAILKEMKKNICLNTWQH